MTKSWLTTEEAAGYLGLHPETLLRLVRATKEVRLDVRCWAKMGNYRWRLSTLDDWFMEATQWRASNLEATSGRSGGGTPTDDSEGGRSPERRLPESSTARPRKRKTRSADSSSLAAVIRS